MYTLAKKDEIDIVGLKYGRLTVLQKDGIRAKPCGKTNIYWLCKCDCGNYATASTSDLRSGNTKSCGCLKKENAFKVGNKPKMKHEQSRKMKDYNKTEYFHNQSKMHGYSRTRLYNIWQAMKTRCYNPNHRHYKDYGARGIRVCTEWEHDFLAFRKWALENGYAENLSIDRIDNNGNYEPSNCKWTSSKEQSNNKRTSHLITFNGKTQTMAEWAEEIGISYNTLEGRINELGWSVEKALTSPVKGRKI